MSTAPSFMMRSDEMFGRRKTPKAKGPKALTMINEAELKNVLEQERLISDATKVQMMLTFALKGTMKGLALKHKLPDEFELDRITGEIFEKEKSSG